MTARRNTGITLTYLNFSDDLELLLEEMEQKQAVLTRLGEKAANGWFALQGKENGAVSVQP